MALVFERLLRRASETGISGEGHEGFKDVCTGLDGPAGARAHDRVAGRIEPQRPRDRRHHRRRESFFRRRPEEKWIGTSVPALVDPELFAMVQQRLRDNRRRTARHVKHPYLSRGLLSCPECGRILWERIADPDTRGERRYHTCGTRDRFNGRDAAPCPRPSLRANDVEHVV
ncbi:zinc ribbon domain-containing protein [Sorangium sp. So ce388]|uniref:zinc ribbon domain-containing protein n=1 Tax=Sorangium sp. So ce388 TaxID=3133309 RepID=UPI003F5C9E33